MSDQATISSPEIHELEPNTASKADGEFILGVKGIGFTMHSQVFFDDEGKATGMLGQDLLSAPLNPALYEVGTINVTVKTGEHVTSGLPFTLTEPVAVEEQEAEPEPPAPANEPPTEEQ